jgi:hypothetical protein
MTIQETRLPSIVQREVPLNRILGAAGILGSPMLLVEGLLTGFRHAGTTPDTALVEMLYLVGWAGIAVGIRRTRAAGDGPLASTAFLVHITGIALAAIWSGWYLLAPGTEPTNSLFQLAAAAWPLSTLFWVVVGALVVQAGVWRGWRRFAPLICGLTLPAFMAASLVAGREVAIPLFSLAATLAGMAGGWAVAIEDEPDLGSC